MKRWLALLGAIAVTLGVAFYVRLSSTAARPVQKILSATGGALNTEIQSIQDAVFNDHAWYAADSRGNRIHLLDSAGKRVKSFGREGPGPGEFRRPLFIASAGDRVYIAELTIPDVSVFDTTGAFLLRLSAERPCGPSGIVAMNAVGDELYVLRRCLEPSRVRYQIERSVNNRLVVWDFLADTAALGPGGTLIATFPLFAVDSKHVLLGVREEQCLTVIRRRDGVREGVRCLAEIPRLLMPTDERARLVARFGKRLALPDSMPRAKRVQLRDSLLFVQALDGFESTTWKELHLDARSSGVRTLGRQATSYSFLSPDGSAQLSVWDELEGVRTEVTRVRH